jgi:hypothetical protein
MQLFLSHASADQLVADRIRGQIEPLGHTVYLAEHDKRAGAMLANKIDAALKASDVVIALLTASGFDSRYVHQEIGAARNAGKLVIPVLESAVAGADLGMLNGLEYIVFEATQPADGLESLTERVAYLAREQQQYEEMVALLAAVGVLLAAGAIVYYANR